jgi:PLP dependent protein
MNITQRIDTIRARIAAAAQRAHRNPAEVTLVAVTKTHTARVIAQAITAGITDLGENRVQEAAEKVELLIAERSRVHWHLIGHLQRNKAKLAVANFDMIHSVDSLRLAQTLDRQVDEQSLTGQRRLPILLQVNVSGEASKEGFQVPGGVANREALDTLLTEIEPMLALPRLEICGLMTIAPIVDQPEQARSFFHMLRELRDHLAARYPEARWAELSMGMTDDFEVAIEEGATLVRVGRAIFGERPLQ